VNTGTPTICLSTVIAVFIGCSISGDILKKLSLFGGQFGVVVGIVVVGERGHGILLFPVSGDVWTVSKHTSTRIQVGHSKFTSARLILIE
jgi:hypothetical protein